MPAVSEETSLSIRDEQWDKFFESLEEDRADLRTDLHLYAERESEMSEEEAKVHKFRKAIFGEEGKREDFTETKLFFKTLAEKLSVQLNFSKQSDHIKYDQKPLGLVHLLFTHIYLYILFFYDLKKSICAFAG